MNFVLLSEKFWHEDLFKALKSRKGENWYRINDKVQFDVDFLEEKGIDKVFIPHWSYIIPRSIWENYECIVFHMTDLPYGRGGSPLQNLIVKGHNRTKISAIRVNEGLDTGDIYLKRSLSLHGTAEEIFIRSSSLIQDMIVKIIEEAPIATKQIGKATNFKRRKAEESSISQLSSLEDVFDYIRMLDCEGYPPAYIDTEHLRFEFTRASLKADKSIIADVRITKK